MTTPTVAVPSAVETEDASGSDASKKLVGYSDALLRTLSFANVKLVRFLALDVVNQPRCKAVPLKHLRRHSRSLEDHPVAFAQVVLAGLPNYGDAMVDGSGLNAEDTVVLQADAGTLRILPYAPSTAVVLGNLISQTTGLPSDLCPRSLLRRVVDSASASQVGFNVGVELEFCLHDAKTNMPVDTSNFASTVTLNRQEEFVSQLLTQLDQQDVDVELVHAESAPGQVEVVLQYRTDAVEAMDRVVLARETIQEVAHHHGLKALFLPKIHPAKAGNGMHLHLSLRDLRTGENLFVNSNSLSRRRQSFLMGHSNRDISDRGQSFMEGILQHLPALLALTLPTTNSFRRVGPGCWTGSQVSWAFEDKEAPLRVVANLVEQKWEHVEYKLCDGCANPYLALSGILLAGICGVDDGLVLRPSRHDAEAAGAVPKSLPVSLSESLDCLEQDEFLMSVLPATMTKAYLALRRAEVSHATGNTLEDEVAAALDKA